MGAVDALVDKGLTVKQIAELYGCSVYKISTTKSRKPQGWREDGENRNPISSEELDQARRVSIGTKIWVCNLRKERRGDGPGNEPAWGEQEESRIVKKFPHLVLLENGLTADYAEVAMQLRKKGETACL